MTEAKATGKDGKGKNGKGKDEKAKHGKGQNQSGGKFGKNKEMITCQMKSKGSAKFLQDKPMISQSSNDGKGKKIDKFNVHTNWRMARSTSEFVELKR